MEKFLLLGALLTLPVLVVSSYMVSKPQTPSPIKTINFQASVHPSPAQVKMSSQYIYPNSKQIGEDNGSITLESNDSPESISKWYQDLLNGMMFSNRSFIGNNYNGRTDNQIVASDKSEKVEISIKGPDSQGKTNIEIIKDTSDEKNI